MSLLRDWIGSRMEKDWLSNTDEAAVWFVVFQDDSVVLAIGEDAAKTLMKGFTEY